MARAKPKQRAIVRRSLGVVNSIQAKVKKGVRVAKAVKNVALAGGRLAANLVNPKLIRDSVKAKGMVLPGSKYVGPGNEMDKGRPVSAGDRAAYEHDLDYDRLLKGGIKPKNLYRGTSKADDKAIKASKKAILESGDPNALGVYLGMGAKKVLAHTIGKTKWGKKAGFVVNKDEDFLPKSNPIAERMKRPHPYQSSMRIPK